MFQPYTLEEGVYLVKTARTAVEYFLRYGKIYNPKDPPRKLLGDNYGVFTTIETLKSGKYELRGCIGYPQGYFNTLHAVIHSAIAACCQDPRFPALQIEELPHVIFEISILSPLKTLENATIQIGRHGLIVKRGPYSGLLLPQVAVEHCWDVTEFLTNTCIKAWLPGDCWLDKRTKIYVYEAQIFREETPMGNVYQRDLTAEVIKCSRETLQESGKSNNLSIDHR